MDIATIVNIILCVLSFILIPHSYSACEFGRKHKSRV